MALTSQQVMAELQRKRNLGIKPTDTKNMASYNKLTPQVKTNPLKPANPAGPTRSQLVTKQATAIQQPVKPESVGEGNSFVRKSLVDNGYADSDIGWDGTRKMVTLKGMDFLSPTRNIGGSTVASNDALAEALSRHKNTETTKKTGDILGRLETTMNTPYKAPEFNFDPDSDPVYQAALRRAQANAKTGSGNAAAEMNRRGILNSTITGDRIAQIEQSELGRVSDEILPQLFDQAYTRHQDTVNDQREDHRNSIADQGNMLNITTGLQDRDRNYDQTQWTNRYNYGNAIGRFGNGQKTTAQKTLDYNQGRDKTVDEQWEKEFDRGAEESDRTYDLSADDNARQWVDTDARLSGSEAPKYDGLSANAILDNVKSSYTEKDADGNNIGVTKDPARREQMFLEVVDAGLPDSQTRQVLTILGLKKDEIDAFLKKHSGN